MTRALERERALSANGTSSFFQEALERSAAFREAENNGKVSVKWNEMPVEDSPHGLIKWLVHEDMNVREHCLDIFMLFLDEGGWSGKHRHLTEELLYVVEGEGYDLHWDVDFDCKDEFIWNWQQEPQRVDWHAGQYIYIPPYTVHKHFAAADKPCRLISITSRIIRAMGFDWVEQLEESSRRTGAAVR